MRVKEESLMTRKRLSSSSKPVTGVQLAAGPGPSPQFMSVSEVAEFLRMSKVSIRRYLGMGKLKKFKVGSRTLIRRDDVLALVREG